MDSDKLEVFKLKVALAQLELGRAEVQCELDKVIEQLGVKIGEYDVSISKTRMQIAELEKTPVAAAPVPAVAIPPPPPVAQLQAAESSAPMAQMRLAGWTFSEAERVSPQLGRLIAEAYQYGGPLYVALESRGRATWNRLNSMTVRVEIGHRPLASQADWRKWMSRSGHTIPADAPVEESSEPLSNEEAAKLYDSGGPLALIRRTGDISYATRLWSSPLRTMISTEPTTSQMAWEQISKKTAKKGKEVAAKLVAPVEVQPPVETRAATPVAAPAVDTAELKAMVLSAFAAGDPMSDIAYAADISEMRVKELLGETVAQLDYTCVDSAGNGRTSVLTLLNGGMTCEQIAWLMKLDVRCVEAFAAVVRERGELNPSRIVAGTWNEIQDGMLRDMAKKGATWKKISTDMCKPEAVVHLRFAAQVLSAALSR